MEKDCRKATKGELICRHFGGDLNAKCDEVGSAKRGGLSTILAVSAQAALFGLVHFYYKGAYGALPVFAAAIFIGTCYVLFGRNLWPLILSHGAMNTLGFVAKFLVGKAA
ncbi:MAG: lysostaphin resistance A-like protein [Acidobacteriota bacterium]